jgi:hypothetical protein
MIMIDGNTHALNEYIILQDKLNEDYENMKQDMCHKIVEHAFKIMKGECTDHEFEWTFEDFIEANNEDIFGDTLDCWVFGLEDKQVEEICLLALESASLLLYDTELSEIAHFNESDWTSIMVDELVDKGVEV